MSDRKRPSNGLHTTRNSKRTKISTKLESKPFRFRDLPISVRKRVYRFCLVDDLAISIKVDEGSGFEGEPLNQHQIFGNPDCVELTSSTSVNTSLLLVNSTIYEEAAPILYGRNTFSFHGKYCWIDFAYFKWRLKKLSENSIRKLALGFPEFDRITHKGTIKGFFEQSVAGALASMTSLLALQTISFCVFEDIMSSDLGGIQEIHDALPQGAKVIIDIRQGSVHFEDGWDARTVRISSGVIDTMQQWGWDIEGRFELVDQRHRFRKERKWLQWLREDRQRGLRSGIIEEDGGIFDVVPFWM